MTDGPHLWCNVGPDVDVAGLLHLCNDLLETVPDLSVTLTSTQNRLDVGEAPFGAEVVAKPEDTSKAAEAFLSKHRPGVAAIAGSDLPAAMMTACRARGIPMIYLDARNQGKKGLRHWLTHLGTGSLVRMFHSIQAVTAADAAHMASRGAEPDRIEVTGALEPPPKVLSCDEDERDYLAGLLGTRPVWLAAGLPMNEFDIIESAFQKAGRISHRLLLILSPNDPGDGPAMAEKLNAGGWRTASRSLDETPDEETRILIGDLPDEEGLWYRLASITYLGGSITSGPHPDPYMAGSLGSAIVAGRSAGGAAERTAIHLSKLVQAGGCRVVQDASSLGETVSDLLAPDRAALLAGKAWNHIFAGLETKDRAHVVLADLLTRGPR